MIVSIKNHQTIVYYHWANRNRTQLVISALKSLVSTHSTKTVFFYHIQVRFGSPRALWEHLYARKMIETNFSFFFQIRIGILSGRVKFYEDWWRLKSSRRNLLPGGEQYCSPPGFTLHYLRPLNWRNRFETAQKRFSSTRRQTLKKSHRKIFFHHGEK